MIKISRTDAPTVLKSSPQNGTHYNKKKVVQALWNMQREKCCYCEQIIPNEGHAKAVEHFQPKSIFKFLRNDWKNLLLACAECNGTKSDKFPIELTDDNNLAKVVYLKKVVPKTGKPLLINPSDPHIDPEDHIDFVVDDTNFEALGIPVEKNGSKRGRVTIEIIKLHAHYYVKKRRTFLLETLLPQYETLLRAHNSGQNTIVQTSKMNFISLMASNHEFAAVARSFCRAKKLNGPPFHIDVPGGA
jgi:uncharacterized protein (TIGR02646 family)